MNIRLTPVKVLTTWLKKNGGKNYTPPPFPRGIIIPPGITGINIDSNEGTDAGYCEKWIRQYVAI
jgi:hypothetical protein